MKNLNTEDLSFVTDSLNLEVMFKPRGKKKVDYEALNAPLMQIPRMSVEATRNLLDLGIREIFQLQGRAPEVLFEEALQKNEALPADRVRFFRMAVYFAETSNPDPKQLHPDFWA